MCLATCIIGYNIEVKMAFWLTSTVPQIGKSNFPCCLN